ncbi:MAG: sigma-54-dependent Fis family transcriptional regulator [Acidobacteria bacterium]|nr:MAG: sigma-54-dependent Fis family transcriptional regulator [Acidobacteriota bacterium]
MNPDELKLLELLKADKETGVIRFKHRRMLIFDADALGLLRKELIETLGLERARRLLTRFGYACGYRDALTSKKLFHWQSDADWLAAGPRLHTLEGIVQARLLRLQMDKGGGVFEAEAEWLHSYEAEQHLKHLGHSDSPVCWTLTGYASGHTSAVFGSEVCCFEKECVGQGDARCLVEGRATTEHSDQMRALVEYHRPDNINAEFRRLLDDLEQREKELAAHEEKVKALESQVLYLQETINEEYNFGEMVGASPAFKKVVHDVEKVAWSDSTVLICGETGTGKELIAHAIHARSSRNNRPLITVNCAALPAGLVESELFGHEKGAFTGAIQRKLGRFQVADGGTIFLDEVGELPLETQAKFLRALQQGEVERLGGTQTIKVDVRVLAATNRPLEQLVAEGKFRSDLFYRLNVFPIILPPLRERREDIALFANYFAQKFRARLNKKISSIDSASLERLQDYAWPGNVRELEHMIERSVLLAEGEILSVDWLLGREERSSTKVAAVPASTRLRTLEEMERDHIVEVLRRTQGAVAGKGGAAEILDLPPSTLRDRMKKLGLK